MSRRNTFNRVGYRNSDDRASLGDSHVDTAIGEINKLQQRAAAAMVHYTDSREATLRMLFRDEDISRMQMVRGMVEASSKTKQYDIGQAKLTIDYEGALLPTFETCRLHIQPDRFAPLNAAVQAIRAVHLQYEEVKGVLRWLNRNATPGAIRFYFPTAMKLAPKSPIWEDLQAVPSRYTVPDDIAAWTQPIKDAANTAAASAMLPSDIEPRKKDKLWLTFSTEKVHLDQSDPHKVHYQTDAITYNL